MSSTAHSSHRRPSSSDAATVVAAAAAASRSTAQGNGAGSAVAAAPGSSGEIGPAAAALALQSKSGGSGHSGRPTLSRVRRFTEPRATEPWHQVFAGCEVVAPPEGTIVVYEETHNDTVYLVTHGSFTVQRASLNLCTLHPGDFFGELSALVPNGLATASVVAAEPESAARALPRARLAQLLREQPALAGAFIGEAARRLARLLDQLPMAATIGRHVQQAPPDDKAELARRKFQRKFRLTKSATIVRSVEATHTPPGRSRTFRGTFYVSQQCLVYHAKVFGSELRTKLWYTDVAHVSVAGAAITLHCPCEATDPFVFRLASAGDAQAVLSDLEEHRAAALALAPPTRPAAAAAAAAVASPSTGKRRPATAALTTAAAASPPTTVEEPPPLLGSLNNHSDSAMSVDSLSPGAGDWERLLASAKPKRFKSGQTIVKQGQEVTSLFQIVSGRCRAESTRPADADFEEDPSGLAHEPHGAGAGSGDPQTRVLGTIESGSLVGEISYLGGGGGVASAAVVADSREVEVLAVDRAALRALFADDPQLEARFTHSLALNLIDKVSDRERELMRLAQLSKMVPLYYRVTLNRRAAPGSDQLRTDSFVYRVLPSETLGNFQKRLQRALTSELAAASDGDEPDDEAAPPEIKLATAGTGQVTVDDLPPGPRSVLVQVCAVKDRTKDIEVAAAPGPAAHDGPGRRPTGGRPGDAAAAPTDEKELLRSVINVERCPPAGSLCLVGETGMKAGKGDDDLVKIRRQLLLYFVRPDGFAATGRAPVDHSEVKILSPIQNAIESMAARVGQMRAELRFAPPRLNSLQQVAQGSVVPMVNVGPSKMAEVFLSKRRDAPGRAGTTATERNRLRALMRVFLAAAEQVVDRCGGLATARHAKFQELLEQSMDKLTASLQPYVAERTDTLSLTGAAGITLAGSGVAVRVYSAIRRDDVAGLQALFQPGGKKSGGSSVQPPVDPNMPVGEERWPPLHCAAACSAHAVLLSLLKNSQVRVMARDRAGDSALHVWAQRFRPLSTAGDRSKRKAVKPAPLFSEFLKRGAQLNVRNNLGETPLHRSALNGPAGGAIAKLFLASNATVNARSARGETPLHYAVAAQNDQVVPLLLQHGANVHAANADGLTPLALARRDDNADLVALLEKAAASAKRMSGEHAAALASGARPRALSTGGGQPMAMGGIGELAYAVAARGGRGGGSGRGGAGRSGGPPPRGGGPGMRGGGPGPRGGGGGPLSRGRGRGGNGSPIIPRGRGGVRGGRGLMMARGGALGRRGGRGVGRGPGRGPLPPGGTPFTHSAPTPMTGGGGAAAPAPKPVLSSPPPQPQQPPPQLGAALASAAANAAAQKRLSKAPVKK